MEEMATKLVNIFSLSFKVETLDHINKKKPVQTLQKIWIKNWTKITEIKKDNPHEPQKLKGCPTVMLRMTGMTPELFSMIKKGSRY